VCRTPHFSLPFADLSVALRSLQNFSRTWPSISLTSPAFIASCILVIVSHFASFNYFSERTRGSNYGYNSYNRSGNGRWNAHAGHNGKDDTFLDVATYFGVCVWLCPCTSFAETFGAERKADFASLPVFLFLSLSANDNVLPSASTCLIRRRLCPALLMSSLHRRAFATHHPFATPSRLTHPRPQAELHHEERSLLGL